MSEFAFLFRGRDRRASPEQMQKTMRSWVAWFKELSADGCLRDGGHPLADSGIVVSGKQKAVRAGTHAQAGDAVGGYMLIEARDLAHAVEISKGCPILENGGSVEVRPVEQPKMQMEAGRRVPGLKSGSGSRKSPRMMSAAVPLERRERCHSPNPWRA